MFRYQILIEYIGTSFLGWQIQKKGKTIQGLIQKNLSKLLDEKITIIERYLDEFVGEKEESSES